MSITVEDLKSHLNITSDDDDALLANKIAAATAHVENYIGKPLAEFIVMPEPLNEAIRQLAANYYENREAVLIGLSSAPLPYGAIDLIEPYRVWRFA